MTIKELYEFAKSIKAENAEIELSAYDDCDAYCGDVTYIHATFRTEDEKNIVFLTPERKMEKTKMNKYSNYVINRLINGEWVPTETVFTEEEARERAKILSVGGKMTEVVYSPAEDFNTDVLMAFYANGDEIGKGKRVN